MEALGCWRGNNQENVFDLARSDLPLGHIVVVVNYPAVGAQPLLSANILVDKDGGEGILLHMVGCCVRVGEARSRRTGRPRGMCDV